VARRSNGMKDLFTIASKLPWWISLVLAVITHLVFKNLANMDVSMEQGQVSSPLDAVGQNFGWMLLAGISQFLQFLVPGIFVVGALAGFLKQQQGDSILRRTQAILRTDEKVPPFESLSWQEFESLLSAAFRAQGYRVVQASPGPDGGVDLTLHDSQGKTLVQCKHWRSRKVGVNVVRELLGSMTAAGVSAGIVVCSGEYTQQAHDLARTGTSIKLIDGRQLKAMLREGMNTEGKPVQKKGPSPSNDPACPNCRSEMVMRTAQKGPNAGGQFWGCSRFPKCRGIRAL